MLRACANVGLVTQSSPHEKDAEFELTPIGSCLQSNVPGSLRSVLDAWAQPSHWQAFQHFETSIKTGQAATHAAYGSDIWTYYQQRPQEQATFAAAMSDLSRSAIAPILAAISLSNASMIVDVGGSHGDLLAAVLTKAPPQARGILFDLEDVIATAPAALAQNENGHQITPVAGNFFDSVPKGDVYLLKHVFHDWSDDECVAILKTIARHAPRGARVLVIELVLSSTVEPAAGIGGLLSPSIFMDVNMLSLSTGRERTAEQYAALYTTAGLHFSGVTPTPSPYAIVEGTVE
ncbi:hypothetical protein DYB32_009358 [Aphanomyces invadans]|uniref:O-methyltransferase C-terminal domain-containing protein n=1 Tax=Aphanomyces invadans TaxID=157072 RepID=A0A3R7CU54_9STRA|nr:hypothetical protein DYB32_009358 [Aphanomyces invadans]